MKTAGDNYTAPTRESHSYGDNQVLVTSAITAALKWAEDFETGEPGAKPTTMIEICSTNSRRTSVFEEGTLEVKTNAYMGVDCDCGGTTVHPSDGQACAHTPFVSDPKILNFLLHSSADGVAQVVSPTTEAFANLSNEELAAYENNCALINNN